MLLAAHYNTADLNKVRVCRQHLPKIPDQLWPSIASAMQGMEDKIYTTLLTYAIASYQKIAIF